MSQRYMLLFLVCFLTSPCFASITIDPSIDPSEVVVDSVIVGGVVYQSITINGFPTYPSGEQAGVPSVPFIDHIFLLPPEMQLDQLLIVSAQWDTLPGKYFLYPAQTGSMEDTTFTLPDPEIYASSDPWPSQPVEITGQGGMMSVGVVHLSASPIRYIPSDSLLLVLTSVQISLSMGARQFEVLTPERETVWSAERREAAILGVVENPEDYSQYQQPQRGRSEGLNGPLLITEVPSAEGDGVDMVIICPSSFETAWQALADTRTKQGIITVVKTVEWIEQNSSGCDIQERIRNFLVDAKTNWGITMVLLGGDDETVPARRCWELNEDEELGYPSDDYYGDLTEDWTCMESQGWSPPDDDYDLELFVGRVPADTPSEVTAFQGKEQAYENPSTFPSGFARKMLLIGDSYESESDGQGAQPMEELNQTLITAGIAPPTGEYLDSVTELYYPANGSNPIGNWSGDLLSRASTISNLNAGFNIVLHLAHSGIHQMGTGAPSQRPVREYLFQGDLLSLTNTGQPSILYTLGCWAGHFEGADCIAERGLFSSGTGGLVASISLARSGNASVMQYVNAFIDALYGYTLGFDDIGPYMYLGEAYAYAENAISSGTFDRYQNCFGDPSMFVWRGDPTRLQVTAAPTGLTTGMQSVSITVKKPDGTLVPHAVVCLYKAGEVFAVRMANDQGVATFADLPVSTTGSITVTATKRKTVAVNPDVVNFLPGIATISVTQGSGPLVCLQGMTINDDESGQSQGNGDNLADLCETIELDIQVENTGTTTATDVIATLTVIGGSGLILDRLDMSDSLGSIAPGDTLNSNAAFCLELDDHFDPEEDPSVLLRVTFSYNSGMAFISETDFRVYEGNLRLVVAPTTLTAGSGQTTVSIDSIYIVNPSLGALEDVQIQFTNPWPNPGYVGVPDLTSCAGDVAGSTGLTLTDGISVTFAQAGWSGSFDLVVSDSWGTISTTTINASELWTDPPGVPSLLGAGDDWLSVEWSDYPLSSGYFIWTRPHSGGSWTRRNLLPIPVLHGTATGLTSGTLYDVAVTTVSTQLQESPQDSADSTFSTCLPSISGWPVQLDGSTGSGPAVADMDLDGDYEVVAATSTGCLYIIEGTGGTPSPIGTRQPYIFTGVAIGDIYPGLGSSGGYGRPEVAASGWDFGNSRAVVLVYMWSGTEWTLHQTIAASFGGSQRIHEYLSSPVLFQANSSGSSLEIALRTFKWQYSPGVSKLYVWSWDGSSWDDYGTSGYPLDIPNGTYDYGNPCYIGDLNGNGSVELALAAGTEKLWLVEVGSTPTCVEQNLSVALDSSAIYSWSLGSSMLTSVDQDGNRYLVGTAWDDYGSNPPAGQWLVYCYRLARNLTGAVTWTRGDGGASTPGTSEDHFGNIGGLAIGDMSSNSGLEIVQQWDRYETFYIHIIQSALVYSLSTGSELSSLTPVKDPHQEDPAFGPVVTGGSIGGYSAALFGYSNLGHAVRMNSGHLEYIAGFPYWTEDLELSAPVISDMDGDGLVEVLMVDDSGLMQLFDWNVAAGSGGWPTFQHDNWRTGYYGTSVPACTGNVPDVSISLAEYAGVDAATRGETASLSGRYVRALVEITGLAAETAVSLPDQCEQAVIPQVSTESAPVRSAMESGLTAEVASFSQRTIEVVALTSDGSVLGRAVIRLQNGVHEVRIPLSTELPVGFRIAVAADPSNELTEADEGNNTFVLYGGSERSIAIVEDIVSRDGRVVVTLAPQPLESDPEVSVSLYSLDGRLVEQVTAENEAGQPIVLPSRGDALPAGCYMVVVEQGDTEFTQKVVVLR